MKLWNLAWPKTACCHSTAAVLTETILPLFRLTQCRCATIGIHAMQTLPECSTCNIMACCLHGSCIITRHEGWEETYLVYVPGDDIDRDQVYPKAPVAAAYISHCRLQVHGEALYLLSIMSTACKASEEPLRLCSLLVCCDCVLIQIAYSMHVAESNSCVPMHCSYKMQEPGRHLCH